MNITEAQMICYGKVIAPAPAQQIRFSTDWLEDTYTDLGAMQADLEQKAEEREEGFDAEALMYLADEHGEHVKDLHTFTISLSVEKNDSYKQNFEGFDEYSVDSFIWPKDREAIKKISENAQ